MRRIAVVLTVIGTLFLASLPALAEGAEVYVSQPHDDMWFLDFEHVNPCTGESATVTAWAEHFSHFVDQDGDTTTDNDQHKNSFVAKTLWAEHSDGYPWIVETAWSSLNQSGWNEEIWFSDQDQATVLYRVRVVVTNIETGDWYQMMHHLRWVSTANGDTIFGNGSQTYTTTGCQHIGYFDTPASG